MIPFFMDLDGGLSSGESKDFGHPPEYFRHISIDISRVIM